MPEFQLEDSDGNLHEYNCQPHPPIERGPHTGGLRLVAAVVDAAGRPLARLVESNLAELMGDLRETIDEHDGPVAEMPVDEVIDQVKEMDLELVDSFDDFMEALQEADPEWLFPELLRHTSRDGKPLSNDEHFNAAFQSNYAELLRAVREVVRINGFFGSVASRVTSD